MSIVRPQPLLDLMRQHWRFVAALTVAAQQSPMFDMAELERIAAREMADKPAVERLAILFEMQKKGLLQEFPRSRDLQLHPAVQTFAEAMLHEHQLGLFGVLRANVEAIKHATDKLNGAVAAGQFQPMVKEAAMSLQVLCRNIRAQVDHDHQAILNIADVAKAADANLPLQIRYQRVLEAFDRYISSMVDMIMPGQSGEFDRYVLAAELSLEAAETAMARTGGLMNLRRDVHNVALMVKDLPGHTRERMNHAMNVLLPMREQVRKHSAMSVAVIRVLSVIRKRGLKEALPETLLPDVSRIKPGVVHLGLPALRVLADFKAFEPVSVPFPDMAMSEDVLQIDPTTQAMIEERLVEVGPEKVPDLLAWISVEFPAMGDVRCLGAYHRLLSSPLWRATANSDRASLQLQALDIDYHPHRVEPVHAEDTA